MTRFIPMVAFVVLAASSSFAQTAGPKGAPAKQPAATAPASLVEFEMMTWPEVKAALASGKTTALVYTGGTEQRGPQNVNGGHTLMAREIVKAVALKLGNAIAMPVLPYTPNTASAQLPGTIGLTPEILRATLERITEQTMTTGFKNVVLMGDHGGGQPATYAEVAKKLDAKYSPSGRHVYFCDEVYAKAQNDFNAWLEQHGYPRGAHGAIADTSTMLYLGGDKGWVRQDLIAIAEGDPVAARGRERGQSDGAAAPRSPARNNGITGDARRSTAALGKMAFDMKIDYAVKQIQGFLANQSKNPLPPR